MIKLVTLLTLVTVVWTLVAYRKVDPPLISSAVETTAPETLGIATESADTTAWNTYTNEKLNFRLRYFSGIQITKLPDESLVFSKDTLYIAISQHPLSAKDTVNTIAEMDINAEMEIHGDKFKLLESISPVAIGDQTGVTFTLQESDKEITYFYIPQGDNYLKIVNKTVESESSNQISLSDDLIYSLEIIDK